MNQKTNMAKHKNKKYYQKNNSKDTQFLIYFSINLRKTQILFFWKKKYWESERKQALFW